MRKRTFEYQDDEIESESHCLSSNSQTQSLHSGNSGRLSDLSSKKNEIDCTKLHSKKSNSSDATDDISHIYAAYYWLKSEIRSYSKR